MYNNPEHERYAPLTIALLALLTLLTALLAYLITAPTVCPPSSSDGKPISSIQAQAARMYLSGNWSSSVPLVSASSFGAIEQEEENGTAEAGAGTSENTDDTVFDSPLVSDNDRISLLVASATYSEEASEFESSIPKLVSPYIPEDIDFMLCARGWTVEFARYEIPDSPHSWGVTVYPARRIIVRVDEDDMDGAGALNELHIRNTILHEIGHAIDFECGMISDNGGFAETIDGHDDDSTILENSDLSISLRKYGEDATQQYFAQCVAHYLQHPDGDSSCPAMYRWMRENIAAPVR